MEELKNFKDLRYPRDHQEFTLKLKKATDGGIDVASFEMMKIAYDVGMHGYLEAVGILYLDLLKIVQLWRNYCIENDEDKYPFEIILLISAARSGLDENINIAKTFKSNNTINDHETQQFIYCGYILGGHLKLLDSGIFEGYRNVPFHIIGYIVSKSMNDLFDKIPWECW
ncbi:MAG: hypothetical protein O7C59_00975 [Rickettsia endosymbiont of Ixodes persulcatus]|nr:hypothetical protein [Rickettsia endosymbiont of Ixodes persulcatus]